MSEFNAFLEELADHEDEKSKDFLDTRKRIVVNAGIRLNWIGDFLSNPNVKYEKKDLLLQNVRFTGTNPEWNAVLLKQCNASIQEFQQLIAADGKLKAQFTKEASFGEEPILAIGPNEEGYYEPFDGMHRVVGAAIENRETITAFVPQNSEKHLPFCEAHVVYDVIRGYQRHARDEQGKIELYHALTLLARTYGNVIDLLQNRFGPDRLGEDDIQQIIQKVIAEHK